MKLALGMITKNLLTTEPIDQFISNARKFNHTIDSVIIAYSERVDYEVVRLLEKDVQVHLVHIMQDKVLDQSLRHLGLLDHEVISLIGNINEKNHERAGYGVCRNHVIIKAMLEKMDVLVFIDTDVYPEVVIHKNDLRDDKSLYLKETPIEDVFIQEVDFIGAHLKYLKRPEILLTTSDYTGYYIIPPMNFSGMQDLFSGLKKESAYNYITNSYDHHCLSLDHGKRNKGFRTHKVLGGNVAIKLDLFRKIVPFYSSVYEVEGKRYLTRGEDTVLALQMASNDPDAFYDIDMKIFHNTYSNFPLVPDITKESHIKDRFFYACMGWLGRNPFLNDLQGQNIEETFNQEHRQLEIGAKAISEYLNDDRFLLLPKAHGKAYDHLNIMKDEFNEFKASWLTFIRRLK